MTRIIKIFDTTLRDGEQSPGCSMNKEEKLELAIQLEKLGVDVIEAGFAISSPGDFASIQLIAKNIKHSTVCSLARTRQEDIEKAGAAIANAKHQRIHTFIATSPIHMEYKLKMTPDQVVETAVNAIKLAKTFCEDVEFSCEDAGRSELEFLYRIIAEVIKAGATVINIPDTVGYTIPAEFAGIIRSVRENTPGIDKVDLSVHCHNDLGLGVANSLAAVMNGANQIECTINGIGERAGNTSLEEVVMAIRTRRDYFNAETKINTKEIMRTSKLLTAITGVNVQPNKAIVGANAFAHEAGIHQDGVLKHRQTYEIMAASDVGLNQNKLVLGKHSGKHAFVDRLKELGYAQLTDDEVKQAFERFKTLADRKKEVREEDLRALISDEIYRHHDEIYKLTDIEVSSGMKQTPYARVVLEKDGSEIAGSGEGAGVVDAIYNVIEKLIDQPFELVDYVVQAVTEGTDATGEVVVRIRKSDKVFVGRGSSTDVVIASAKAYVNAINRLLTDEQKINP